jgi:hypothetical protein
MKRILPWCVAGLLVIWPVARADDLGQRRLFDNLTFYAQTSASNGAETDAASAPTYRVYEDGTFMFQDSMVQTDGSNTVGYYSATIQLLPEIPDTPMSGFEPGKQYSIRFRGTVNSVNKADFHTFTIHPTEISVQHDGNDSTSGSTAESTIEDAPARTIVVLGSGVFDIGTEQIVIPTNVSVRGVGIGATQITKSNNGICIVPGDRSIVEQITVKALANSGQGFGADGTQQFDDALLRDAQIQAAIDAVYLHGTGGDSLTIDRVWLDSNFDGIVVGQSAHNVWMRDVFIKAAHVQNANGIIASNASNVHGTRVEIDITSAPYPNGVGVNDTAIVVLFDSCVWVDPSVTYPSSINVNPSTAQIRIAHCEFDRSLTKGNTQQVKDVFSPGRPTLLIGSAIESLSSQTEFILTTGPPDDNALNGRLIVIADNVDGRRKAVGVISSYVGSTRKVTLTADPAVFTMVPGDNVDVLVEPP